MLTAIKVTDPAIDMFIIETNHVPILNLNHYIR
jgi:hypothetical protein